MECEPGGVRSRALAEQGRDFTGLRFGRITPTDVDGVMDFRGRGFVLLEAKRHGASFPFGQRKALERMCDGWQRGGIPALLLIVEHSTPTHLQIDMGRAVVVESYWMGKWRTSSSRLPARRWVERFMRLIGVWDEVMAA